MRQDSRGVVRLKHLKVSGRFPSGNPRHYFRRQGAKDIPMPDAPKDSQEFLAAYVKATKGEVANARQPNHQTGTIGAALRAFLASDHFLTRATSTRRSWRRFVEEFEKVFAKARLTDLQPKHIRLYLARYDPHPANNRLKVWRAFCRWCVDAGLCDEDAARAVRPRRAPSSDGHAPWTNDDVKLFRKRWPVGSMQRLAMELMIHTGAAIGDAIRIGPGNVQNGWISYRRVKSKTLALSPLTADWPEWFPGSPYLLDCIERAPRALTFLCTASGKPRSAKAASQWFSKAAKQAGLSPDKTSHGLRKHQSVAMAERGASTDQRMAILGHDTTQQTQEYSKSADARRIISGTKSDNFSEPVVINGY